MAILRTNLSNLMKVDLDRVLFEAWKTLPYERILNTLFNLGTSDKKEEVDQTVGGFGLAAVKSEGADLAEKEFREGYKTTYTHKTLGYYTGISFEANADEQYGIIKKAPKAMARSVDATINYYTSRIFGRGNNATEDFITGGDGVALLSASHPLKMGGTSSNTPSTQADLSATTLWAGITAYYEMLDDAGKPIANTPKYLVIPHQTQQKGIELLFSDKFPESAENAVNALRKAVNLELVVWPYWLGNVDSDCWFIVSDKNASDDHPLRFFWRLRPQTDSDNDFYSKDFLYSLLMRFSLGYDDWRFVYGSMGG